MDNDEKRIVSLMQIIIESNNNLCNDILVCKIKRNFPFLLRSYPRVKKLERFVILHILHITCHRRVCDDKNNGSSYGKIVEMWYTYRYPFCKKERYLI